MRLPSIGLTVGTSLLSQWRQWIWPDSLDRRGLQLSMLLGLLVRVPNVVGLLLFLPMVRFAQGLPSYNLLLASIALGAGLSFLSAGIGVIGRRQLGEAKGADDIAGSADALVSLLTMTMAGSLLAAIPAMLWCWWNGYPWAMAIVALITIGTAFGAVLDNARAAWNQHYVTALLFLGFLILLYGAGLTVPVFSRSPVLAALVIHGPYALAAIAGLVLAIVRRPALLRGSVRRPVNYLKQALLISSADGLMNAALTIPIVYLETSADPTTSGWFASIARLFVTILAPLMLIAVPIGSFIRLRWAARSAAWRQSVLRVSFGFSVAYGVLVSVILFGVSHLYVGQVLHLRQPDMLWAVVSIFLLFGTFALYRGFSAIAYLVLDPVRLSVIVAISFAPALLAGVIGAHAADPLTALALFSAVCALALTAALGWTIWHAETGDPGSVGRS